MDNDKILKLPNDRLVMSEDALIRFLTPKEKQCPHCGQRMPDPMAEKATTA